MWWLVTVEKIETGKRQQRRIQAETEDEAGKTTCVLIGGPASDKYRVVACKAI